MEPYSEKVFPTLYKRNNFWTIRTKGPWIYIEHGTVHGKNNQEQIEESSPGTAQARAASRWNEKVDRESYSEQPYNFPKTPMLALEYQTHGHTLPSEIYFQPKLDGIRCVANNCELKSRKNTYINSVPHIKELLRALPDQVILDGELYNHGWDFQTHLTNIRPDSPTLNFLQVKYHVFDLQSDDPFYIRLEKLQEILKDFPRDHIQLVPTTKGHRRDIESITDKYISDGYEGAILRNPNVLYEYSSRSTSLLKYKRRDTTEFQIVGWTAATKGKEKGCAIAICTLPKTHPTFKPLTFEARLSGTLEYRRALYNFPPYPNSKLYARINHFGYHQSGLPVQPSCDSWFYEA